MTDYFSLRIPTACRLWIVAAALLVSGCGFHQASGEEAIKIAEGFFSAVKAQDYDQALTFYDDEFFVKETREERKVYMTTLEEKLGPLESWSLREDQVSTIFSGRRYVFKFVNKYANANATETLVLMQPVDAEEITIVAHQIESLALPRNSQ